MREIGKKFALFFGAVSLILLFNCSVYAANNPIRNGYYMIQSGNASDRVLDINNFSMSNGGNLEIYQKNKTSNQVFYVSYGRHGYCYIQAVHSGYYLHKANGGRTDDVHQWEGYGALNTQWALESAGNGYYYVRNRSGNYLDNSGGRTDLGNNVITYPRNYSAAQKWKFIPTKKPKFSASLKWSSLEGTYKRNFPPRIISGRVYANYPVTKLSLSIYNSRGKEVKTKSISPSSRDFTFSYRFVFSNFSAGKYYYRIRIWNVVGDEICSRDHSFSIKR